MKKSRLVQITLPAIIVAFGWAMFSAVNAHDDKKKTETKEVHGETKEAHKADGHKHDDHKHGHHHHKGKTRVASSEQLMEGLVNPNCKALAKEMKAKDGKTNFKRVRRYAALLNESGYVLMADGRCPDKIWAASCKAMQTHSVTLIKAAKESDTDGVNKAFKLLTTEGCAACHKKHRSKHHH